MSVDLPTATWANNTIIRPQANASIPNYCHIDALASRKQLLWIRDGAVGAKRVRVCASDNENFRACLSLLRVVTADEVDLERILGTNPYGSYRTASDVHFPISLRNECAALSLLKHTCQSMLDAYPRTLTEDFPALAGDDLAPFSNERHARIHARCHLALCPSSCAPRGMLCR